MVAFKALLTVLSLFAATTIAQDAPPASPDQAIAILRSHTVNATFVFQEKVDSLVVFRGQMDGPVQVNGKISYHIHVNPVPADGNCTGTGGHLDPAQRKGAACTAANLNACEVGDLSAKFGKLEVRSGAQNTRTIAPFQFSDPTLRMTGKNGIVGRSVVMHNEAGARIACGNIVAAKSAEEKANESNQMGAEGTKAPSAAGRSAVAGGLVSVGALLAVTVALFSDAGL